MKSFVLIICVALASAVYGLDEHAHDERQNPKKAHTACQSDPATHVDEEVFKKIAKGEKVEDAVIGPHLLCMSTKMGMQKENGEVDKEALRHKISHVVTDAAKVDEIVEKCAVEQATPAETAKYLLKCFHENTPQAAHHHAHAHAHHH